MRLGPDFTLSTGPTKVSPTTLAAMAAPVTYHYDPDFLALYRQLERDVARVFGTEHDVVLLPGEAALGLEAALAGVARPGGQALAVVSGIYGEWMAEHLRQLSMTVAEVRVPFDDAVHPDAVEEAFLKHPKAELLVVVHCESASGTVNPLQEIAAVARDRDALVVVDAVASLGGMPLEADGWGLDVCVAGPQKCLSGPVAMSLLSLSPRAWERIEMNPAAPRGSFISLVDYREKWLRGGRFPSAPPISDVFGTAAAIDEALAEGLDARQRRHATAAAACRAGIQALGLDLWAKDEAFAATSVTAARLPDSVDSDKVCDHIRENLGVMLSAGVGVGNLVRIGHMGETSRGLHPLIGIAALGQGLKDFGLDVHLGAGVEATMAALSGS